jgi:hypothetical protein
MGVHLAALYAILHPHVSRRYRAYFIDRTSSDWAITQYHSTPEEGIVLSRAGLPDFVDYSYGISVAENWGRWTDTSLGLRAGFQLKESFSGPVCVAFEAGVTPAMLGRQVVLEFGDQRKPMVFGRNELHPYAVDFDLDKPADSFEFLFPDHMPPASEADGRQLGIGLARVRILSHACAASREMGMNTQ